MCVTLDFSFSLFFLPSRFLTLCSDRVIYSYTCNDGFHFVDESGNLEKNRTIACTASGEWEPDNVGNCISK